MKKQREVESEKDIVHRGVVHMLRQSMERDLQCLVGMSDFGGKLRELSTLGIIFEPRLVLVEKPAEKMKPADALDSEEGTEFELAVKGSGKGSKTKLAPKMLKYKELRKLLPSAVNHFGRSRFCVADVVSRLRLTGISNFEPKHVSVALSKNAVDGFKFKITTGKKGDRVINTYRKTR